MNRHSPLVLLMTGLVCTAFCTLNGCTVPEEALDPTTTIPSLRVLVLDSQTGEPVTAATVTVTGEGASEALTLSTGRWGRGLACGDSMFQGVHQAGTYQVSVAAAGYEPVIINDVVVPEGWYFDEGVVPVNLLVELRPASAGPSGAAQ